MSLRWLTIAQIERDVTRFNFSAFGGMKRGNQKPGRQVRRPGEL